MLILSPTLTLVKSFPTPRYKRTKFAEKFRTVPGRYRIPYLILSFSEHSGGAKCK